MNEKMSFKMGVKFAVFFYISITYKGKNVWHVFMC